MDSADLSLLNWNVRGLNDAAHRELVRNAVISCKPNIVCLQETKLSAFNASLASETLGQFLDSFLELPAQGTRGGILLAWNKDVITVTNAINRTFTISAMVTVTSNSTPFLLSTCYGPADDARKEEFLAELLQIKPAAPMPWLIIGDFNLIYQAADKSNLNLNRRLMAKFRRVLDDCELIEIALQNRKYTWSNERQNPTLVRLDRVFCNSEWEMAYPDFNLTALGTGGSDHCPLFLNRQYKIPRKAVFRFKNHWIKIDGFQQVVMEAWNKLQVGSAHSVLNKKLNKTAKALRTWSKPLFSS